jgi:hypothetical protein
LIRFSSGIRELDSVTIEQWSVANTRIMERLVQNGILIRDYSRWTTHIHQMASVYQWRAIRLYDDEYRQHQAEEGFTWGAILPWLVQNRLNHIALRPTSSGASSSVSTNSRSPICNRFNQGRCTYRNCNYQHICSNCRSHSHSAQSCSQARQAPRVVLVGGNNGSI